MGEHTYIPHIGASRAALFAAKKDLLAFDFSLEFRLELNNVSPQANKIIYVFGILNRR